MHKVAVAFFYTCAVLSITFTALVFIGKASAQGVNSMAPHQGARSLRGSHAPARHLKVAEAAQIRLRDRCPAGADSFA